MWFVELIENANLNFFFFRGQGLGAILLTIVLLVLGLAYFRQQRTRKTFFQRALEKWAIKRLGTEKPPPPEDRDKNAKV